MRFFRVFVCGVGCCLFSLILACVYLAVQQNLRMSANDPQIQMAQDAAASTDDAVRTIHAEIARAGPVRIERSLAPWMAVYARDGRTVASSGLLDGAAPQMPPGVFAFVQTHGEDRITWQPQPRIRAAVIVTQTPQGGFVVAGRSLREIEQREGALAFQVALTWIVGMLLGVALFIAGARRLRSQAAG